MIAPVHVLIPVKQLSSAKLRMAEVLSRSERRELVLAMLQDVLVPVRGLGLRANVLSPDPAVLAFARTRGAYALPEWPGVANLNEAIEHALESELGDAEALMVLLPDTPLTTAAELEALIAVGRRLMETAGSRGRAMALNADRSGKGSSALYLEPPRAIRPKFGLNSAALHVAEAKAHAVPCEVLRLPGLGLDVDTAADLRLLVQQANGTQTHALLEQLKITERLALAAPLPASEG